MRVVFAIYTVLVLFQVSFGQFNTDDVKAIRAILDSNGLATYKIADLPMQWSDSGRLTQISMSDMGLTNIPDAIGQLDSLVWLTIDYNEIETISPKIGKLKRLKALQACCNNMKYLPDEIGDLVNLERVELMACSLEVLPSTIGNWTKVTSLSINENQLTTLPDEIMNIPGTIYMFDNKICTVSAELKSWLDNRFSGWWKNQDCFDVNVNRSSVFSSGTGSMRIEYQSGRIIVHASEKPIRSVLYTLNGRALPVVIKQTDNLTHLILKRPLTTTAILHVVTKSSKHMMKVFLN